ncbi:MAG: CoA transferase [Pyrinomonadaceae bacterium]|nr:CoA transferase [Pyrinomonadaceae bacterium]MBP9108794.1 CoA transferase [Pyrinomonadaceae bacterium]
MSDKPLKGLQVVEMGQLLAGPFCGSVLAGFGADVIKIEKPKTGDPLRVWRKIHNGTSLWWASMSRNKRSITLDMTRTEGQAIARRLAEKVDILLENFKPGTMEKWGMGFEELRATNPGLIMVRVSGWGQTGPYASRPGFANVAEGFGGLRYITGEPGRPPVRTGTSMGDTLAGMHAALGTLIAVYHRDVNGGNGQVVDVALYESVFNMMESSLSEYDKLGVIRERLGAKIEGIVPTSTYPTKDGKFIIIGGNGDSIYRRLMTAMGRPDLAAHPEMQDNAGRVAHEPEIDQAIADWTLTKTYDEAHAALLAAEVPTGPVYSIADIIEDEQYNARGMFETVELAPGDTVKIPTMLPKLTETPGGTDWPGPKLGEHNEEIYREFLGMSEAEYEDLIAKEII